MPDGRCIGWGGRIRLSDGRAMSATRYAYRVLWEQLHGPLARATVLHHRCENPGCVNLKHVQPLTRAQHMRIHGMSRGDWGQSAKTHCPAGHQYDRENTYRYKGERHCRECRNAEPDLEDVDTGGLL